MKVTVKLHTTLKKFAPPDSAGGKVPMTLADGATVRSVTEALGIPGEFVGAVFLGPARADLDAALSEGVEVNLLAPIGGG